MKKRLAAVMAAAFTLVLALGVMPAFAEVGEDDVAKIGDTGYADLHVALEAGKASGTTVELLKDVDLTSVDNWVPVTDFNGTFDGKGYTITGLSITGVDNLGLFASTNTAATVKDLTISGAKVAGIGTKIGVLAGSIRGSAIQNVTIDGAIVTVAKTTDADCQYTGGLTGYGYPNASNCTVKNSTITGYDQVGGFIGYLWVGGLNGCTAEKNTVTATSERAGGLIGKAQFSSGNVGASTMNNDGNTVKGGTVTAPDYAGGFAGQIMGDCDAYTIKNNKIEDVALNAPVTSPIGAVRSGQEKAFLDSLATKVAENVWNIAQPDDKAVLESYGASDNKYNETEMQVPVWADAVCKIGDVKYASLKAAYAAAKSGDTVELLVDEIDSISGIPAGVTLQGIEDRTVVTCPDDGCGLTGSITDATISNLKFVGKGSALRWCYAYGEQIVVYNCEFDCDDQYGIHFDELHANLLVKDCIVTGTVAISATDKNIVFEGCTFAGRSNETGHCNMNFYSDASFLNCTFSDDYCTGAKRGILMPSEADDTVVTLSNCSLANSKSEYKLTDVFRRDCLCVGAVDGLFGEDGTLIAGTVLQKQGLVESPLKLAEGSNLITVVKEPGDDPADFCLVGKGATASGLKVTGGKFATDPGKYIADGYVVADSGDNDCPFLVRAKQQDDPEQQEVIHEETTEVEVSKDVKFETEEEELAVQVAAASTEVTGVKEALVDGATDTLLGDAQKQLGSATVNEATLIEYEIAAVAKVTAVENPVGQTGTLAFEVKPVATVTTHKDGEVTGVAENVAVDNKLLTGAEITVTVGCAGVVPVQVVHTCSNGTVEVFKSGTEASHENLTFLYDETTKTVTVKITQFSALEVFGAVAYANVTFDKNADAAEGAMDVQGVKKNTDTALTKSAFTRAGYEFTGWNTKADGTGTAYEDGATVKLAEDTTLYAQWNLVARVSGADRYETAAKAALEGGEGSYYAIVASGENFPDALCASGLAGIFDCPILLTGQSELNDATAEALESLGVKQVYVVGGLAAISSDVVAQIKAVGDGIAVERICGDDRYATAEAIYEFGLAYGWNSTAILATGVNYPDALSISSYAFRTKSPILLVDGDGNLTKASQNILANGRVDNALIVGGAAVVPVSVNELAKSLTGTTPTRLAGEDRYGTSLAIAKELLGDKTLFEADGAIVATGKNFADALAGGPLAGSRGTIVLLADSADAATFDVLAKNAEDIDYITVLGGESAVPATVFDAALEAADLPKLS